MDTASDLYEDAAVVYTRLVGQVSPEAAAAIEQIHAAFGSHAALRAALIIMMLHIQLQDDRYLPNIGLYAYLFDDYPEAQSLLKDAMTCLLESLTVAGAQTGDRRHWQPQDLW